MSAGACIRPATPDDAALLAALARSTFVDTYGATSSAEDVDRYLKANLDLASQRALLSDAHTQVLLATVDGAAVGYAVVARCAAPPCISAANAHTLARLYVVRAQHGSGLAQRLFGAALEVAAARAAPCLWLCVWDQNRRAIAFYAKQGCVQVGTSTFLLGTELQHDKVLAIDPRRGHVDENAISPR